VRTVKKEEKAEQVLDWLAVSPQTSAQLMTMTQMTHSAVHQGIAWLRDYDPNCVVGFWEGGEFYYKLAANAEDVRGYVHNRSKMLYRMAVRLETMVRNAIEKWPENRQLRIMARHLARMREDVEEEREASHLSEEGRA
jgi:hypothetical protein